MTFVLLFCIAYALVIYYMKREELKEYNIYEGEVIGFTNVTVTESVPSTRGHSHSSTFSRDIPIIQYTDGNGELVSFEEGHRVIYSSFELYEKVKILENKQNTNKTVVLSFFYYWFHLYELIIFLLLLFIFYVFISAFIFKDFYIADF